MVSSPAKTWALVGLAVLLSLASCSRCGFHGLPKMPSKWVRETDAIGGKGERQQGRMVHAYQFAECGVDSVGAPEVYWNWQCSVSNTGGSSAFGGPLILALCDSLGEELATDSLHTKMVLQGEAKSFRGQASIDPALVPHVSQLRWRFM